ncbi:unnamed protein product [Citrullus colocynthis]|uniref:Uncharacterized protein n=1 Tax=Citrullus colocynthis TaxID=252529 RepID=A0ABP0YQE4_9ROSI
MEDLILASRSTKVTLDSTNNATVEAAKLTIVVVALRVTNCAMNLANVSMTGAKIRDEYSGESGIHGTWSICVNRIVSIQIADFDSTS